MRYNSLQVQTLLILLSFLEAVVIVLATWVVTSEVVLYSRTPSVYLPGLFLAAILPMILVYGGSWGRKRWFGVQRAETARGRIRNSSVIVRG